MSHPKEKIKIELKQQLDETPINGITSSDTLARQKTLEQLIEEIRQAHLLNHKKPVVDASVRTSMNSYYSHVHARQANHQLIRRNLEQELSLILKPLNSLDAQSIVNFSVDQINKIGGQLGLFEQNLEIDMNRFFAQSLLQTRFKLTKLLTPITYKLKPENLTAFQNILSYLKILETYVRTPIEVRIKRDFKFYTPTRSRSLFIRDKIVKTTASKIANDLQPVNLDFAQDQDQKNAADNLQRVKKSPNNAKKTNSSPKKIDPKLLIELKEKNDEICRLRDEIRSARTEMSKVEDTLSKVSEARTHDQVELQTYGVREVEFLNRDLVEKLKNMELNKKILQLEKRIRELEYQLKPKEHSFNTNQNNQTQNAQTSQTGQMPQPSPTGIQATQIVFLQNNQQTFNYLNTATTANIQTDKTGGSHQTAKQYTQNVSFLGGV